MRSCSGKYGHTGFGGSYIDFTGSSADISTKRYKLLQTALGGSLNISLLPHFSGHISLSQTVILPCCSTAAQYSHFQHEQPFSAGSARKPGGQIHQMLTPKVFMVMVFMGSSSLERW